MNKPNEQTTDLSDDAAYVDRLSWTPDDLEILNPEDKPTDTDESDDSTEE